MTGRFQEGTLKISIKQSQDASDHHEAYSCEGTEHEQTKLKPCNAQVVTGRDLHRVEDRLFSWKKLKDENHKKIANMSQYVKEKKEMRECTFKPSINQRRPSTSSQHDNLRKALHLVRQQHQKQQENLQLKMQSFINEKGFQNYN